MQVHLAVHLQIICILYRGHMQPTLCADELSNTNRQTNKI